MKIEANSYLKFSEIINDETEGFIYFDTPDIPDVVPQDDDKEYVIEAKYHRRPDKLAFDAYGDINLFWVIAIRNGWDHPNFKCITGAKIFVPSKRYVNQELLK